MEHQPNPNQPIYNDAGTQRFRENRIVNMLLDSGPIDMNKIAVMSFSAEDRAQFAQLIGYSVSGFAELSYVTDAKWDSVVAQMGASFSEWNQSYRDGAQ
jgi:hypothetical protein